VRGDLRRLQQQVNELQATVKTLSDEVARSARRTQQARTVSQLDTSQRQLLEKAEALLDEAGIVAHVRKAVAETRLETDPFPHVVVEKLLPTAMYKLLLKAIPPPVFFSDRDPIKQNLRMPLESGPALTVRVLNFLEEVIARQAIRPAVLDKFHDPLQRHYDTIFGPAFRARATSLPQSVSGGRVMLRRPGYHLSAHRDPKRALLTCLMYFARSSDIEQYGTQIYRVRDDGEAGYVHTYYPEEDGRACELVKMVPYRPNTMLVFLNSSGAHGADIPRDAPPDLERYSYQFYVGPDAPALEGLVNDLPPERRAMWQDKKRSAAV
jgi:hypothetical protein